MSVSNLPSTKLDFPRETETSAPHLSAVIDVLRFPLISLVVLYHAFTCSITLPPGAFDWHQPVTDFVYWSLLHDAVARSAVPLFFALSGYLYFRNGVLGWSTWWNKTKTRFFRLWIPLWTWAGLHLLLLSLLLLAGSANQVARTVFLTPHPLGWWLDGFLGLSSVSGPHFLHAGWFVRDLFFVGLLSPLWQAVLCRKWLLFPALSLLFVLYLTVFAPLPFLGSRAMFFFCLGAAYAIHRRDFAADAEKIALPCAFLWAVGFVVRLFKPVPVLPAVTTALLIPVLVAGASRAVRRGWLKPAPVLAASAFFVYFGHVSLWFRIPKDALLTSLFIPYSDGACLAFIVLNWIMGTFLPVAAFLFLRRFAPATLVLLVGQKPHARIPC